MLNLDDLTCLFMKSALFMRKNILMGVIIFFSSKEKVFPLQNNKNFTGKII